ncbi:MAG: NAD(+)/NADH kinase [Bacteroidales bacterium]|nr:NAD(+)/NADH kinase [Bacteroidales bacterium]
MKFALFGRNTEHLNLDNLNLLIGKLLNCDNVTLCCYKPFYESIKEKCSNALPFDTFSSYSDLPQDINVFLSLGGDGTFLESLTFIRDRAIPVAGINFGRLGFLTTAKVEPENEWIDKLLSGNYNIEERTLLYMSHAADFNLPEKFYPYALNEITLQRKSPIMLEITVSVDGKPLPVYMADGILIGSATGSTAYSLSIGGPIVTPDSKVLIIAPIAPHNLNVRPIIVPETSVVEISYVTRGEDALLTADNRSAILPQNQKVVISKGDYSLKSISINNSFIEALSQKLLWGVDKRNMLK